MDPWSALSCAAAVLQFVDFSAKLVGSAYEIYTSGSDTLQENIEIEKVTTHLRELSERVEASLLYQDRDNVSQDVKAIADLAQRIQALSKELVEILDSMKMDRTARFKSWEAFQKAFRASFKTEKIRALQSRNRQSFIFKSVTELQHTCQLMRIANAEHIAALHHDLAKRITKEGLELRSIIEASRPSPASSQPPAAVTPAQIAKHSQTIHDLSLLVAETATTSKLTRVLESLRFEEMPHRHWQIRDNYTDTYAWIFDTEISTFADWLANQDGLFWISGKAGSGKSTLLKYLADSPRTKKSLAQWAAGNKLHTASFYFWNAGNSMQKSQQGLLQSLLFQVLSICPEVAERVCPDRWKSAESNGLQDLQPRPWKKDEIVDCLERTFALTADSARFCFFIDGLDEYQGDDHYTVIQLIDRLQASKSAKFCVSSRPWNVFRLHYGDGKTSTLTLEDKTRSDMSKYIRGTLELDARFLQLKAREPEADGLAREVSEKANGVFLWVFLVVRELLHGLNELDDLATLQRRLRALPVDLELYFQHMLDQLDRFYQEKTAMALLVAVIARSSPPADVVYGIENGTEWAQLSRMAEIQAIDYPQRKNLRLRVQYLLNKWCRDLLGISSHVDYDRIEFLHRTVRDFLCSETIWRLLEKRAGRGFNPRLLLCRAFLAQIAYHVYISQDSNTSSKPSHNVKHVVLQIMYYSAECERYDSSSPIAELEELDRLGTRLYSKKWTAKVWTDPPIDDFLAAAVACDLKLFVQLTLQQQPKKLFTKQSAMPLICWASVNGLEAFSSLPDQHVGMVKMLREQAMEYDKIHVPKKNKFARIFGSSKRLSAQEEFQRKIND
ncbi:hypothetical protein ONZ43_g5693 [Nemania bipapillata]|uniref:Uncharacterized protein n=1 Tax=Nemania bipapillata TaxID=110536 RepID=A0ACC2I7K6_9PEZI|nr:hypothetical protein ONZ43_g5693 [Nemania bipapillata]